MSDSKQQDEQRPQQKKRRVARVEVDRDLCIGAASCIALAPETFELDAEGKAIVKDTAAHTDEEIIAAAESCPTKAIALYDEDGNRIYP